jgi:hypothetical protein
MGLQDSLLDQLLHMQSAACSTWDWCVLVAVLLQAGGW